MPNSKIVMLDFWASWCGPCKVMKPIIEELEKEYAGKIEVKKIQLDSDNPADQQLAEKYQVMSIPTYFFEKNGNVVGQIIGASSKSSFKKTIDGLLE